jgi:hypothetical protein
MNTTSHPAACTRFSRSLVVERPELPVAPLTLVLDRDLSLGKGEIDTGEATRTVFDPVLRHRMQAGRLQPHAHLRLRPRLRPGVGQLDDPAGGDDAAVRPSGDQRGQGGVLDQPGSEDDIQGARRRAAAARARR